MFKLNLLINRGKIVTVRLIYYANRLWIDYSTNDIAFYFVSWPKFITSSRWQTHRRRPISTRFSNDYDLFPQIRQDRTRLFNCPLCFSYISFSTALVFPSCLCWICFSLCICVDRTRCSVARKLLNSWTGPVNYYY